jgi:hypothetical protein
VSKFTESYHGSSALVLSIHLYAKS